MTGYEFDDRFSLDGHTSFPKLIIQFYYEVKKPQCKFLL